MAENFTKDPLENPKKFPNYDLFQEIMDILPQIHKKMINFMRSDVPFIKNDINKFNQNISNIKRIINIFQGKWLVDIIFALITLDVAYFNEIKRLLPQINPRTLTDRLRHLEKEKLITRNVINASQIRIFYILTPLGRDLLSFLIMMHFYLENRSAFKNK